MAFTGVKLHVGRVTVRSPKYPSEPGFVEAIRKGMRDLQKNMLYIIQQFEDVTPEFMVEALQPIFDESQILVPVDTGDLKASGYLEIVSGRTGDIWVDMGYGRNNKPDYAAYVHEMVQIPHKPPTQAKFLEKPVNDGMLNIIDTLAAKYKDFGGF